jgi:glutamate--cysteine ligase
MERLGPELVQEVLVRLASARDELHFEAGVLTETNAHGGERVTVEPGGQIEFSGAPRRGLAEIERDLLRHTDKLAEIAEERGLVFLAAGFDPFRTIAEQRWFPKPRYGVMRPYLQERGARAWDMMSRTCSIQANLDYGSEEDLARKFILGNRLAPVITAIFANSPFENGRPSGYKSTRAAAWLETDPDRTGLPPLKLLEDFSLEAFVDYTLSVPVIFTRRGEEYSGADTGRQFGAFLEGPANGAQPIFQDWTDHLTTIFTDARLKQYVEMRSADCCAPPLALALQALWKGLMYDAATLEEALRLAPKPDRSEALALQERVARQALEARHEGLSLLDLAKETVRLAAEGLGRVAPEELKYLDPLREMVLEDGVCPADILLRDWHGSWHGSPERLVADLRAA